MNDSAKQAPVLGIEFGSTRIKAVLIDGAQKPIASGSFEWENELVDGIWTYQLETVWEGLQKCYADMARNYKETHGETLRTLSAIGFSGMMHGYLPFDASGALLTPFRTWRNTTTGEASKQLTERFQFNIPQRWSIAHLYQAILNAEPHVPQIDFLTTLAGYVHWKLTGEHVVGAGEASGIMPLDSDTVDYRADMVQTFDALVAEKGYAWQLAQILPKVLGAGAHAGNLTEAGARLLDPTGNLQAGIPLCPPEGDAGTGMVATNAIAPQTGNVSAGTSIFAMLVLEKNLSRVYEEIDMVTTPDGLPTAMVHCNNCTSDINAWLSLFQQVAKSAGAEMTTADFYTMLFQRALQSDADTGDVTICGYVSGEPVTGAAEGRPLVVRGANSKFTIENFMCAQIYSAIATLKIGMDLLLENENVTVKRMLGHGGLFKTPEVAQGMMAAALGAPVSVMETAGEGGAWGMALLADFMRQKAEQPSLAAYLNDVVFAEMPVREMQPAAEAAAKFARYMQRYQNLLEVERTAIRVME